MSSQLHKERLQNQKVIADLQRRCRELEEGSTNSTELSDKVDKLKKENAKLKRDIKKLKEAQEE